MLGVSEAYRLLRLIIILAFLIGALGLAAWVVTKHDASKPSLTNVTNIGTIQNEFLTVTGQPLNDPELKKVIEQALEMTAQGNAKASIPLYQQAIQKAPLPDLYTNLAAAYEQQNDNQQARAALQNALARNASYAPAVESLKKLDEAPPLEPVRVSSRESEPNDDLFHPNIIPLNTGVLAAIEPASDVDTFQFEALGKSRDWIDVTLVNRSTELRPGMRVLLPNKEELVGWNYAGTAGADHELAFVAQPNTKYFVQVASFYSGSAGAYVLTVEPRHAFDQYEPNDDIASAAPISVGSPVKANIMDAGDQDFYRFESGAAGDMTVTLDNTSTTLAPGARVYDATRSDITGWQENRNAGGHLKFSFTAAAKAVYYVQVGNCTYGNAAGSYTLTVR